MLFKATETQVRKIAVNALAAAGLKKVGPRSITVDRMGPKAGVYIDSLGGCKVSLRIKKCADKIWHVPDKDPPKGAKWATQYKSYKDLVKSVKDVEIFGLVDAKPKKKKPDDVKLKNDEEAKAVKDKADKAAKDKAAKTTKTTKATTK